MSRSIGDSMPAPLLVQLARSDETDDEASALLLVTVDDDGAPRVSFLSAREVDVFDERRLSIEVRRGTATSQNLRRGQTAALWCVLDAAAYSIRLKPSEAEASPEDPAYERFPFRVQDVLRDFEAGAPLIAGPTYRVLS
ncbi:MAG: hypothetical protein GIW99_09970 [Candidatus Eremiobacteraeota bacterium]|nr:hypothetical protein [Candidatus Eremiobacteraeota bacterium]MBC5827989.1 hypothetical protein [Candidatus Eremiobacteraeota bacterium]